MLNVNGFLVKVNEGIEFTLRWIWGCHTQGSKENGICLRYTEKNWGSERYSH